MINTQAFISNNSVSKSFDEIISINQNNGDITSIDAILRKDDLE